MKRFFGVALGILTAIGGFVDIGDIVANAETGARFGMSLAWVVVVGVIGICLFAEMAGRVATVSGRAVFDLVRERLGARVALVNLVASFFITFLTLAAEIGGVALAIELATSVNYLLWVPIVAFLVWLVIWRVKFSLMENAFGLAGLTLVVAAVALWRLGSGLGWAAARRTGARPASPSRSSSGSAAASSSAWPRRSWRPIGWRPGPAITLSAGCREPAMRLSELLGAEVVDQAGQSAGHVHDVRLVQDGPLVGGFGASLRLDGLIVGGRAVGARLGYERRDMKGPLLVKLLAGWLYHDGRYVSWDRIRSIEPERILTSGSVDDLPRPGASA